MIGPTIGTARLILRAASLADAQAVFEYTSDPDVTRYLTFPTPKSVAETRAFLESVMVADGPDIYWAITERASPRAIGAINLHFRERGVAIGYALAKSRWGRGYMTEALRAVLDYAISRDDCTLVGAYCDVENRASARVMQKAGMRYVGLLPRFSVHPNVDDQPRDCHRYEFP